METIDLVFVVLTYINCEDLKDFFASLCNVKANYKVIVVDAFYSECCSEKIRDVAISYGAVYEKIDNKGYSYGNNRGIEIANHLFKYKYIIISNPDVIVNDLKLDELIKYDFDAMGPEIINKSNVKQNPMYYNNNLFLRKFVYQGLKENNKIKFYFAIGLSKLIRNFWRFIYRNNQIQQVFQIHGCFIIFSNHYIEGANNIFDENMFLFAEESYLAWKINKDKGRILYNKNISILHKEDGSMDLVQGMDERLKEANIYVYEKYYDI